MKFTGILKNMIIEAVIKSAFQDIVQKYAPKDNPSAKMDEIKEVILMDPTTRYRGDKEQMMRLTPQEFEKQVKVGKYSKWLMKQFVEGTLVRAAEEAGDNPTDERMKIEYKEQRRLFLEDALRYTDLLEKYERFKSRLKDATKKDINKVTSIDELSDLQVVATDSGETVRLAEYLGKKVKKGPSAEKKKDYSYPGSEILKVGDNYTLIKISDQGELGGRAASYFGGYHNEGRGESNWCTSPEGSSWSTNYRKQGPLYIFLANDDKGEVGEVTGLPKERFQFHFPSGQFKDRINRSIDVVEFLNGKANDMKDFLKPEFAAGLVNASGGNNKKFKIDGSNRSVDEFVRLYGIDEVFESLPDDLTDITIKFRDYQPINIPSSIGRFKRLRGLQLINCIDSLPNEVGLLDSLAVCALYGNANLKKVPDSLAKLPNLLFITVGETALGPIPESFKKAGFHEEDAEGSSQSKMRIWTRMD